MAQLNQPERAGPGGPDIPTTSAGAPSKLRLGGPGTDIPATTQLFAIAWLRWRIFANGFRRQAESRKVAALVVMILLRVLLWPIFALMAIGPAVGAGFLAWHAFAHHHPEDLVALLAGIAIFWQFVAVNGVSIAAAVQTFDPASLLRFPLRFGRYLVLRLLLGLLTPSTIIGSLALFAACVGIGIAQPALAPAAFVVLAVYAAMNIFFSRMLAVWMERWLATRRAREIFGVLTALFFVGIQFFNFRRPAHHRPSALTDSWLLNFLHTSHRILNWLPPGFAVSAILPTQHPLTRLAQFAALLAWTALFLAALAFRLHQQFLGEYLSEGAPRAAAPASPQHRHLDRAQRVESHAHLSSPPPSFFSPSLAACLRKEWLYFRGNSTLVVGLLMPLVWVFILSRGILAHHPSFLLSGSVGYALMGLLAALYNIFGADGTGVQLYLLAPVRLRDVILAKNIASLAMLGIQAALAWSVAALLAAAPIPFATQIAAACWIVFVVFANLALGTLRSIQAPRKIAIGQTRKLRPPAASKTSGLLVLAILFGSLLLEIPVTLLSHHLRSVWLPVFIFAPLAAAAVASYALLLANADRLILTHRDQLAEELCSD